jgi:hypothetical protein
VGEPASSYSFRRAMSKKLLVRSIREELANNLVECRAAVVVDW